MLSSSYKNMSSNFYKKITEPNRLNVQDWVTLYTLYTLSNTNTFFLNQQIQIQICIFIKFLYKYKYILSNINTLNIKS